jgi:hypothetical protein
MFNARNLHVVTKLEVRSERKCLRHRDITPSLEHHHSDRPARKSVADHELGNDVQTDLIVGDSLYHTDGDDINERDNLDASSQLRAVMRCLETYQSEDERPHWHLCRPDLNHNDTKDKHSHYEDVQSRSPLYETGIKAYGR